MLKLPTDNITPALLDFVVDKKTANWPTLVEFSYLNTNQIDKNEQPRLLHALFSYLVNRTLFDTQTALPDFADPFSRLNTCEGLKAQISLIDGDDPFATLLKLAHCPASFYSYQPTVAGFYDPYWCWFGLFYRVFSF
jgi:hypothetical protein